MAEGHTFFTEGEKVLCYEPDPKKAKVLYDSKILRVYVNTDETGNTQVQYKVHFQNWNSSWDRLVEEESLLKNTEENRRLQDHLAERAQLQFGPNLYREKIESNSNSNSSGISRNNCQTSRKKQARKSSSEKVIEEPPIIAHEGWDFSDRFEDIYMKESPQGSNTANLNFSSPRDSVDKNESSTTVKGETVDNYVDDSDLPQRVMLRISERLRDYLEYDRDMIVKYHKQHALPSRMPVVSILENFVKQSAFKLVFSEAQPVNINLRSSQRHHEKKRDFEKLQTYVGLLKEVADGLRIYFDFTLSDYLLYQEEVDHVQPYLCKENMRKYVFVSSPEYDYIKSTVCDAENTDSDTKLDHNLEDVHTLLENRVSSLAASSSASSAPTVNFLLSMHPQALSIPEQTQDYLQEVLAWRLLPDDAEPAPSMVFGAPHLARLLVKLPHFLNASQITQEKLEVLVQYLDSFSNFLEARSEWFNEDNYSTRLVSPTQQFDYDDE